MPQTQPTPPAPRMLSLLPAAGNAFWTGGKSGQLILQRHRATGRWLHPFYRVADDDPEIVLQPVSGKATVFTFTVNLHPYNPSVVPPYIIAIAQLPEQEDLRLVTNIVNCAPGDVAIGMRLRVCFEPHGAHFVPVFEPDTSPAEGSAIS